VVDEALTGERGVLPHRGQGRAVERRRHDVVETHHGDVLRHTQTLLLQGTDGADGDHVARRHDAVERHLGVEQPHGRGVALGGIGLRVRLQTRIGLQPRGTQRRADGAVAVAELRELLARRTDEGDAASAGTEQVPGGQLRTVRVVAAQVVAGQLFDDRSPDHEMRAALGEMPQPVGRERVIAVAEQDQAVGTVADLVIGVPVVALLLEREQEVEAAPRRRARDVPEHVEEERVDARLLGRFFEQQQRQRAAAPGAQPGGAAVGAVMEFIRDLADAGTGLGAHERAVAQRARHGRLRHLRTMCDIERCRLQGLEAHGVPLSLHRNADVGEATGKTGRRDRRWPGRVNPD